MVLAYEWPLSEGDPPLIGTWLDISGDPDKPVLKGIVARQTGEGIQEITILMADGQPGAQDFQEWVADEGDIGVQIAAIQIALPLL